MENENIIMTNKEAQRYEIINNLINRKINGTQAARQLNLSVRQAKRIKKRVKKDGIKGVIHKSRGKESNRKLDRKTRKKAVKIIKEEYSDFTSQLTCEKLDEIHGLKLDYSTVRRIRIKEGLSRVTKRRTNNKYYSQRPRKSHYGELQQFDGSYDNWLEGRCLDKGLEKEQCLLAAIDDATGKIIKAKLAKNESIGNVFSFWRRYIKEKGKPLGIYLDKYSTYKINHQNATDNKDLLTQFQRAMTELGIGVIHAHSPQAKGRVERLFKTLQDRLVKELRLKKINNIEAANEFIEKEFIPQFNKKFSVQPKKEENLHRKLIKQEKQKLNHIFSIKKRRVVRNDFVVQYQNRYFQLDEIQQATVYKKDQVIVEEHLNGDIHISKKDKYLNFTELKEKLVKEIPIKLPAITLTKTQYVPPANHPWRRFQFSNKQQEIKEKVKS